MQQYMNGAGQELYELSAFPPVLHGKTFRVAAGFIFDACHAVLLAVEDGHGSQRHCLAVGEMDQVGRWAPACT